MAASISGWRVTPGASYRLEAWMRRSSGASDMWLEFGYDLTGGVSPEAASVQYTKLEGLGANTWVPFAANLTATGDSLTLFAKGGHWEEDAQPNRFWVDDVTLTLATATPSPSASPSPTASAAPSPSPIADERAYRFALTHRRAHVDARPLPHPDPGRRLGHLAGAISPLALSR
jgi:hypothetical protein